MKILRILTILFFLTARAAISQFSAVDFAIIVADNANGRQELRFGLDSTATPNLDLHLDEEELPPFPPQGVFEARFIGDDISLPGLGQGTYRDYRTGDKNFTGTYVYELRYQVGSGDSIVITWNLPANVSGLMQDLLGGVVINRPMLGRDSLSVTIPGALNKLKMTINYNGIPKPPTLLSPSDKATNIPVDTRLEWNISQGATSYRVQVSTVSDLSILFLDTAGIGSNFFHISRLKENSIYFWQVNATNGIDTSDWSGSWEFTTQKTSAVNQNNGDIPEMYRLAQNYPNPFNPETSISYALPKPAHVVLKIYDVLGRQVRTLVNETKPVGRHRVTWNGRDAQGLALPSGIYLYKIQAGEFEAMRKMLLAK